MTAFWVTVTMRPPTLTVPLRDAPELAAIERLTAPELEPDVVPVNVIQGTRLMAFQAQPPWLVTDTEVSAPAGMTAIAAGATLS